MIEVAGLTILHFVWQGAALCLVAWLALALQKNATAQARYLTSCVILAVMALAPIATALALLPSAPASPASPASPHRPIAAAALSAIQSPQSEFYKYLVAAWLIGAAALTVRCLGGLALLSRLKTKGKSTPPDWLQTQFQTLVQKIGVSPKTQLFLSTQVNVPTVLGAFRGVVLIPAGAIAGVSPEMLQMLLAHELAHVRRYDFLVNVFQSCIEIALFYHPAVWWLSNRIRLERENCCDDLVLATFGDRKVYAHALSRAEEMRIASLALRANGGDLLARIRRILGETQMKTIVSPTAVALTLGALVLATAIQSQAAARYHDPAPQERTAAQKRADEARQKEAQRALDAAKARFEKLQRDLDEARQRLAAAEKAARVSQGETKVAGRDAQVARRRLQEAQIEKDRRLSDVQRELSRARTEAQRALDEENKARAGQRKAVGQETRVRADRAIVDKIRETELLREKMLRDKIDVEAIKDLAQRAANKEKVDEEVIKSLVDRARRQEKISSDTAREYKAVQDLYKSVQKDRETGRRYQETSDVFRKVYGDMKVTDKAFEDVYRKFKESGQGDKAAWEEFQKKFDVYKQLPARGRADLFNDDEQMKSLQELLNRYKISDGDRAKLMELLHRKGDKASDLDRLFKLRDAAGRDQAAAMELLKRGNRDLDLNRFYQLDKERARGRSSDMRGLLDSLRRGKGDGAETLKSLIEKEEKALVTLRSTPTGDMTDEERADHLAKIKAQQERIKRLKAQAAR